MRYWFKVWLYVFAVALATASHTAPAFAQASKPPSELALQTQESSEANKELSDRAVRVLQSFAWQLMPKEHKLSNGTVMKIAGVNPNKFIVPVEDARRIIVIGRRSARAQICALTDHARANYTMMMELERDRKKWSDEQLFYIHQLHVFTVFWLSGNIEVSDKKPETVEEANKAVNQGIAKAKERYSCDGTEREQVKEQIEAYVKANQKSKS